MLNIAGAFLYCACVLATFVITEYRLRRLYHKTYQIAVATSILILFPKKFSLKYQLLEYMYLDLLEVLNTQ